MKILFATPMYGGQCTSVYTKSMMKLAVLLTEKNIEFDFAFLGNESLIPRARNILAHICLQYEFTHLMFIDADIEFNPADVISMVEKDLDVLCGVYPAKGIDWELVANAVRNNVNAINLKYFTAQLVFDPVEEGVEIKDIFEPLEIKHGATGFMLIKRQVLEKLSETLPKYINTDDGGKTDIVEFFGLQIEPETRKLLSEDYDFCRKWRGVGGKIYAAPWVRLSHFGTYRYEGPILF